MYYEYWGLGKAPFDNVPDPSMYVESHSSVENAIAETLFAIEEGNECIAVIVGEVGSGKTLSLRLILDSLAQDKYRIAFITNPDMSFVQLLREIIGQIAGQECETKKKVELLEIFNKLLFKATDEGKKVLIFIDEANALSPTSLESLRLLTNMQDDSHNLLTLVLAGQMELAKRLEHPKRANLFQRIGTYNRIGKIEDIERLKDYVQTRIRLAGGSRMFFTDAAIEALWEVSDGGVPRLVNKICKLCMKAGETNRFPAIDGEVVNQIGQRFRKLSKPAGQKEKLREQREQPLMSESPLSEKSAAPPSEVPVMGEVAETPATVDVEEARTTEPVTGMERQETSWETDIGSHRINIVIPSDILQHAGSSTRETRTKIAGTLAAQTLQKYPQLAFSTSQDPVALWSDIRKSILNELEQLAMASSA